MTKDEGKSKFPLSVAAIISCKHLLHKSSYILLFFVSQVCLQIWAVVRHTSRHKFVMFSQLTASMVG